jgi:ankyrin repeat protein
MARGRSFEVEPCSAKRRQSSGFGSGLNIVKQFGFVILCACALVASPVAAQSLANAGYEFIEAVRKSDGNKATQLLDSRPKGFVDTKDGEGNTGLLIAINRSDEQWTGFLLNKGADPNLAGKGGDTPLIAATRVGFERAVEWLLGVGAKVDTPNRMGETPLIIAVQRRNLPIARVLLNEGANPDRTDSAAGYSARDYASRDPRAREILKLIEDKKPKAASSAAK